MIPIRPAALLVAAVGVSGVLIGLAVGNLRSESPAAAPAQAGPDVAISVWGVGRPTVRPKTTRVAGPPPTVPPTAAPVPTITTSATSADPAEHRPPPPPPATSTTPAETGATEPPAPVPPGLPPIPVKGNPEIDPAVEGDPCTGQGRSGIDSANTTPILCTATDDGLTWLPG